jgi:hypothetical protein
MDNLKYAKDAIDPAGCKSALGRVTYESGGYFSYGLYDDCIYQEVRPCLPC